MKILDTIYTYVNSLEEKRFYQFLIGANLFILFSCSVVVFMYYRTTRSLKRQLILINESRETVREILSKAQLVTKEQKEMDAILAQDENFKIAGNFEDLLAQLGLSDKKSSIEVSTPAPEGNYQEVNLQAKFTGMTMKNLTELLQEIELNKRVFTKELDIIVSQKQPDTIDVTLTIATLEKKKKESRESAE